MLLIKLCFSFLNLGLVIGLTFAVLLLLCPLLKGLLTPQQRVWLWALGWLPAYLITFYCILDLIHLLPVTFRDLVVPRMSSSAMAVPAYLPEYNGPGPYNLALPGGTLIQVELTPALVLGISLVWLAGVIAVGVYFSRKDLAVRALIRRGELVPLTGSWAVLRPELEKRKVQVRLCDGLETSFLYHGRVAGESADQVRYILCLQRELAPERRELVLRHELEHIRLWHGRFKVYSNCALIFHWWNPFMWLANKYFCRDMELACDQAVLDKLEPEERREYARTLVELGAGRQLWDAPLGFGECDAELRVRAAAAWKKPRRLRTAAGWAAFALVFLFFLGGPQERFLPQDALLLWQRQGGTVETLIQDISDHIAKEGEPVRPQQVWVTMCDQYRYIFYACLPDGSWRQLDYYQWDYYRQDLKLSFSSLKEIPEPASFEGMYRID